MPQPKELKEKVCKICQFENGKHSFECSKYKPAKNPMKKELKEIKLRVWWIPQIPMDSSFYVEVATPQEAKKVLDILADYDLFQLKNNIKPDFSNVGGLEVFENGEWVEWYSKDDEDIDEVKF